VSTHKPQNICNTSLHLWTSCMQCSLTVDIWSFDQTFISACHYYYVLWPLYRTTCVTGHLQLRTGWFCWNKVLLPACPCWRQEDARVLLSSVECTVSAPSHISNTRAHISKCVTIGWFVTYSESSVLASGPGKWWTRCTSGNALKPDAIPSDDRHIHRRFGYQGWWIFTMQSSK